MLRLLCFIILLSSCGGPQIVPTVEEEFAHPSFPCESEWDHAGASNTDGLLCPSCTCEACKANPRHPNYYKKANIVEAPLNCPDEDVDGDGKITWHDCYIWDHCRRTPQNCVGGDQGPKVVD